MLSDYGARVVKVGAPPRKGGVQIVPPFYAYSGQREMERIRIDLKAEGGRDAFLRLAEKSDVVIESYRPGVMERLGLGYEVLRARNPRIIFCSTSGYGQDGPYSQWAGHDLNYLALGGFLHCSGRRADGGPPIPGATVADSAAGGMHAVIAILAALVARDATGEGAYLDVSVAEGVLSLMALAVDQHLATGEAPGPGHDILTGRYACYDLYATRDGGWLAVAAIEPAFFANLCRALGLEEWIPFQLDDARQDEIRAAFRDVFAGKDRDTWVEELAPASTCVSPVHSVEEVARDPHFQQRGVFVEARHPDAGTFRQIGPVLAGAPRSDQAYALAGPDHTDVEALLREVGIPADDIAALRSEGVVA